MTWCTHCGEDCETARDPDKGYVCCVECGKILDQEIYYDGPTFEKTGGGQTRMAGSILHSVQSGYSVSRERTLMRGRDEIGAILNYLNMGGGESMINKAHAFYQIAVDKNFTRGRRTSHVAASCLYIACRQMEKAYLLIDFTDYLQTNVYVLGAVFLQLCKMLSLNDHPIIQKLVDPSLFIHRFTERLLSQNNGPVSYFRKREIIEVSETALHIVASMKRDWMQTGRKPSGLCGAALYISALSHGHNFSRSDIVTVVHICERTLSKRLVEFENTESGCLTIEEFIARAKELDEESHSNQLPKSGKLLCEHKDTEEPHFAHGLCRDCYNEFNKISGGLQGGADPPAFQHSERQRMEKAKTEDNLTKPSHDASPQEQCPVNDKRKVEFSQNVSCDAIECESLAPKEPESTGHKVDDTSASKESTDMDNATAHEPESLSDIDDAEVDGYLHNEEEKHYKTIIWEEMNKEYLEEQAAKEAAEKEAYDANIANGFDPETAAAMVKSRKEKRQRRTEDAKNYNPAQTPAEATSQMLKRKGLNSKINYKALEALYNSEQEETKKQKTDVEAKDTDGLEEDDTAPDSRGGDEANTYVDNNYTGGDYDEYTEEGVEDYGGYEEYDEY